MGKLKTRIWDVAAQLNTDADVASYLDAVIEIGDAALLRLALGNVARAKGMALIAEKTGMSRTSLYKAFAEDSRPAFTTIVKVMNALGVRLRAAPLNDIAAGKRRKVKKAA